MNAARFPSGPRLESLSDSEANSNILIFPNQENSMVESIHTVAAPEVKRETAESSTISRDSVVFSTAEHEKGTFVDAVEEGPFGHHTIIRYGHGPDLEMVAVIQDDRTKIISMWKIDWATRCLIPASLIF